MGALAALLLLLALPAAAVWLALGRSSNLTAFWRIGLSVLVVAVTLAAIRLWIDASEGYCCREIWPPTAFELTQEFAMNAVLISLGTVPGLLGLLALRSLCAQLIAPARK